MLESGSRNAFYTSLGEKTLYAATATAFPVISAAVARIPAGLYSINTARLHLQAHVLAESLAELFSWRHVPINFPVDIG
jgi:hypothetical protein